MIGCYNRPTVRQGLNCRAAGIYHWLNCNCHTRNKTDPVAFMTEIRDFRGFMKSCAYSMPDKLSDYRITTSLYIGLYRVTNITDPAAVGCSANALVQAFSRCIHQPLCLGGNIPRGKSGGIIAVIPLKNGA